MWHIPVYFPHLHADGQLVVHPSVRIVSHFKEKKFPDYGVAHILPLDDVDGIFPSLRKRPEGISHTSWVFLESIFNLSSFMASLLPCTHYLLFGPYPRVCTFELLIFR
jgi:hypothetical protein